MGKLKSLPSRIPLLDTRRLKPEPKRADAVLLTPEHRRFREVVLDRAGWRCERIEGGQRCIASRATGHRMIADHKVERADGGDPFDPANGQCLCTKHNTLKGVQARVARQRGGGSNP